MSYAGRGEFVAWNLDCTRKDRQVFVGPSFVGEITRPHIPAVAGHPKFSTDGEALACPLDLAILSPSEREFVQHAVADPKFGAKNAFILNHYFGYAVKRDVDPNAFVPPPPIMAPAGTAAAVDAEVAAKARTFGEIFDEARLALQSTKLQVPGTAHCVELIGFNPHEIDLLRHAFEAIPPWARDYLQTVKQICATSFEAFKAPDGSISDKTRGVADAPNGQLLLNRKWLDQDTNALAPDADEAARTLARQSDDGAWLNTLFHELGHFEDRYEKRGEVLPSRAPDSVLGNHGIWYTNYAWLVQDPAEDMAEGYAILAQERLKALHGPTLH